MSNELLWVFLLFTNFIGILLFYRFFGKVGLFAWTAMALILANLQVLKTIELFGYVTTLGNIMYSSIFLATDILNENHGKKDAQRAVFVGFAVLIATTVLMQLALQFTAHESDFISPALNDLFGFLPRIAVASLAAYVVSQLFNTYVFNAIKERTQGSYLWLRNNASTILSQLLDNVIFTWIAFVGFFGLFGWDQEFEWHIIISIFFTSFVMKMIVAVLDTPVMYASKWVKERFL